MLHAGAEGRSQCSSWLAPGWLQRCHIREAGLPVRVWTRIWTQNVTEQPRQGGLDGQAGEQAAAVGRQKDQAGGTDGPE